MLLCWSQRRAQCAGLRARRSSTSRQMTLVDVIQLIVLSLQAAYSARLQFLEEPVSNPMAELAAFHAATGIPTALDESLNDGTHRDC